MHRYQRITTLGLWAVSGLLSGGVAADTGVVHFVGSVYQPTTSLVTDAQGQARLPPVVDYASVSRQRISEALPQLKLAMLALYASYAASSAQLVTVTYL